MIWTDMSTILVWVMWLRIRQRIKCNEEGTSLIHSVTWNVRESTCVSAPPSASSWMVPSNISTIPNRKLATGFDFIDSLICLPSSVFISPGWSELDVTPLSFSCLANSLEKRMFASLLWPYARLMLRKICWKESVMHEGMETRNKVDW